MPKSLGMFQTNIDVNFQVYVVEDTGNNLLSSQVSTEKGLIKLTISCKLMKITLKEKPALHDVNVVPIPLPQIVTAELNRVEAKGTIQKVTEPTD